MVKIEDCALEKLIDLTVTFAISTFFYSLRSIFTNCNHNNWSRKIFLPPIWFKVDFFRFLEAEWLVIPRIEIFVAHKRSINVVDAFPQFMWIMSNILVVPALTNHLHSDDLNKVIIKKIELFR